MDRLFKTFFIIIIFLIFLFFQFKYFEYSTTFPFVDEYDNIVPATIMIKNKLSLYKDIFRNRAPGPVYVSYLIQNLFKPNNLYYLIIYHRLFIILLTIFFFFLFLYFFNFIGLAFILIFELIKYYIQGNLFLGESLIIYPFIFVYLLILSKKSIKFEFLFFLLFNFFIFLFRETYILLSFFLTFIYFYFKNNIKKFFLIFFISLLFILIFIFINDFELFYTQMIAINFVRVLDNSNFYSDNINFLRSLFYPFLIFFNFKWNTLRIILCLFSLLFIYFSFYLVYKKKINFKFFIILWLVLGLSLFRSFTPGTIYYGAYRGLIWSGFIIISVLYFINYFNKKIVSLLFIFVLLLILLTDKNYFLFNINNKLESFNTNYNKFFLTSEIINKLSNKDDSIFIDGYASLIYSLINIKSSYKYFFYYPVVENFDYFEKEKQKSLLNKPSFYYIDCVDLKNKKIPEIIKKNYFEFYFKNKNYRTCLFVYKEKINNIEKKLLKEIYDKYGYVLLNNREAAFR